MEEYLEQNFLALPANERDHTLGNQSAKTVIVTYGDYESAASAAAHRILRQAQKQLGDGSLRLVYRHFPLAGANGRGWRAAEAAEAAASQNLFWEMHERLFANQNALDNGSLVEHAVEVGVNPERFLREIAAHVHAARLLEDLKGGERSNVKRVPAIFINNLRYETVRLNLDELMQTLNE